MGRKPPSPPPLEPASGGQRAAKPATRRNAQLGRILQILRDLERLGGLDLYELAERQGTTVRTIRRDLDALHDAGLPLVEETDGRRKRWRLDYPHSLRRITRLLDVSHYMALRLAVGQGQAVQAMPAVFATLEDLASKIEAAVGPRGRSQLSKIDACFHSYEKHAYRQAAAEVLWPLLQAIMGRRLCEVSYRTPKYQGAARTIVILPLRIFVHQGAAYLMAAVPKHQSIINLNLQRIVTLRITTAEGAVPAGFDPAAHELAAFGVYGGGEVTDYVLDFTAELAPYIRERIWHPSQALEEQPEGRLRLRFRCAASYEVTAWVSSWRQGVKVIAPDSLKAELAAFGIWCRQIYGG